MAVELLPLAKMAEHVACEAHQGQTDLAGRPYWTHLARVAARLPLSDAKAAGWLHDSVEDTYLTHEILADLGFPHHVLRAVRLLTHSDSVPYAEYIDRLVLDPLARLVKIADLLDNMDPKRVLPDRVTEERVHLKHWRALNRILTGSWPSVTLDVEP